MSGTFSSVWVKEEPEDGPLQLDPLSLVAVKHEVDADDNYCEPITAPENSNQPKKREYQKKYYKKPTKILKCDSCEYTTVYKKTLSTHIRCIHENQYLSCPHCEYTTKYDHSLNRHLLSYHQEGIVPVLNGVELPELKCEKCDYKTYKKWRYTCHLRQKHSEVKKYQCSKCEFKTSYRHSFVKHSKSHEEKSVIYKCDKCPFVTKFTGHMQRHLAKAHNVVSELHNFCDYCDFSTRLKWRLNIHVQKMKFNPKQKCELCDFESLYKCEMKRHKYLHIKRLHESKTNNEDLVDTDKKEACDILNVKQEITDAQMSETISTKSSNCTQNLTDNNAAKSTVEMENKEDMQNVSEPTCSSFNDQFVEYSNFLASNETENPNNSDNCESFNHDQDKKEMNNTANLDLNIPMENLPKSIHIISMDKTKRRINTDAMCNQYMMNTKSIAGISIQVLETSDKNKPFQCTKCEYGSKFKSAVIRHYQRQHTGSTTRPYNCCNCDFSTKTKDQIGLHNKRSKSETELTCTDCDFATHYKCQLTLHIKTHYRFKCSRCTYSCRKENELTRHYAINHLGNGMKCRFCDYKAARKESVSLHEIIHTGEKPHKCAHCDYSSVRKSLLNIHMKRFHNELLAVKIVNPNDLQSKIESLQVIVPSVEHVEMNN